MAEGLEVHRSITNRVIHIIDPDQSFIESVGVILSLEGMKATGFTNLADFLAATDDDLPDAAIINFEVRDGVGLSAAHFLSKFKIPVIMIGTDLEIDLAMAAVRSGAFDVLSKPIDMPRLVRSLLDAFSRVPLCPPQSELTPREREVLALIIDGKSNKETGRRLGISPRTVEVHRARAMEKLGARNTVELVRLVLS
jgi:FixJ family two-component response regulator